MSQLNSVSWFHFESIDSLKSLVLKKKKKQEYRTSNFVQDPPTKQMKKKSITLCVNIHCIEMMLRVGRKKIIPRDTNQRVKSKATNLSTPVESSVCTGFFLRAGDRPALPRHYRPSGWCASVAAALAVIGLKISWKLKTSHLRKIKHTHAQSFRMHRETLTQYLLFNI